MATIYKDYGSGGAGLISKAGTSGDSGSKRHPSIAEVLRDVADDLAELRTKHNAAMAKLDADAGVTDVDYAATCNAAAMTTIKG